MDEPDRWHRGTPRESPTQPTRRSFGEIVAGGVTELRQVSWPHRTVLQHSAVVALAVSLIALLVLLFDVAGYAILRLIAE